MNHDIKERFERLEKEYKELKELLERKPEIKPETICRFILDGPIRESIGLYYGKDVDGYHMEGFYNDNGDFCSYAAKWDHAEPIEQREVVGRIYKIDNIGMIYIEFGGLAYSQCSKGSLYWDIVNPILGDRQEMELYA